MLLGLLLLTVKDDGDQAHGQQEEYAQSAQAPGVAIPPALSRGDEAADLVWYFRGAAGQGSLGLQQRLAGPHLGVSASSALPEARGPPCLLEEEQVLTALLQPASEAAPGVDQRFVHQLDAAGGAGASAGGEQPGDHQTLEHGLTPRAEAFEQGVTRHHLAGTLGGDQAQQQFPGGLLLRRIQAVHHAIRVAGQGAGNSPHGFEVGPAQQPVLAVAFLPHASGSKLKQRQGGPLSLDLLHHLGGQQIVVKTVALKLERVGQGLLERPGFGPAHDRELAHDHAHQGPQGKTAQEVLAQGEDDPHWIALFIGRATDGLHEEAALLLLGREGIELLQLVHQQQDLAALLGRQAPQGQAEQVRLVSKLPGQVLLFSQGGLQNLQAGEACPGRVR